MSSPSKVSGKIEHNWDTIRQRLTLLFSGLGHIALQIARGMGFRAVALSSSASKKELAHQLGAYEYIDGSKIDQAVALKKLGGAKVIMCTAPNAKVIEGLLPGLAVDGTLLLLAFFRCAHVL